MFSWQQSKRGSQASARMGGRHEEKQGRERGVTPRSTRVSLVEAWQLGGRGK